MEIRQTKEGFKNEYGEDCPIEIATSGWEKIRNIELFKLIKLFYENEERIYPKNKGYQGGDKIKKAIFSMLEKGLTAEETAEIANEKGCYDNGFHFDYTEWEKVFCDRCGGEVICEDCHNKYVWINISSMNKRHDENKEKSKSAGYPKQ